MTQHRRSPPLPLPPRRPRSRRRAPPHRRRAQGLRRWRALSPIYRLGELRLRRRPAEDRRFQHPGRLRPARRLGRDHRLRPGQRAQRGRDPPRRRDDGGARSGQGRAPRRRRGGPTPGSIPTPIRSSLIPFAQQGRALPADRRRRPRPRSARRPGLGGAGRLVERDRHRPRRRLRRPRRPAAGPPQRPDRRRAERPARDRLSRPRRALSLRRSVRAGDLEPGDRHRARPGAGQPRIGRRARRAR